MRKPTPEEISEVKRAIRQWQALPSPQGTPEEPGLFYEPFPFDDFANLPCERNSSEHRLALLKQVVPFDRSSVLDLGSANGFFLFRLAQEEQALARGLGIDHHEGNIEISRLMARLYGFDDRLKFNHANITKKLVGKLLREQNPDVCLLLSVHHHLVREIGIDDTKEIFRLLHQAVPVVVVEQGSLTQQEYEDWTSRNEPFATRSLSRLVSMVENCGIPAEHCFVVGMGQYLSGRRDDMRGAGRTIIGFSRKPPDRVVGSIQRKAHKNGIFMEIVGVEHRNGDMEIWKNVVCGSSLAVRELKALKLLEGVKGYPQLNRPAEAEFDAIGGLIRMRGMRLREISEEGIHASPQSIRKQCLQRIYKLAELGMIHNEISPEHLKLSADNTLVLLDFETVYFLDESRETWLAEVAEENTAIGLDIYPREALWEDWRSVDLIALDSVFRTWGLPPLTDYEKTRYYILLDSNQT